LHGALVGLAQTEAARKLFPGVASSRWIVATAVGVATVTAIGILPATLVSLFESSANASIESFSQSRFHWEHYLWAAGIGALSGTLRSAVQWFLIMEFSDKAWKWLVANAVAWAAGMPLLFALLVWAPWSNSVLLLFWFAATGLFIGFTIAVVNGKTLLQLARDSEHARAHSRGKQFLPFGRFGLSRKFRVASRSFTKKVT
jgi:hypothetical protein